jgi:hypothetical protein
MKGLPMSDGNRSTEPLASHWLDRVIDGVVEHNGESLSAIQILNAIMHSPPIVNAIQRAIDERGPSGALEPSFAQDIRQEFLRVVDCDDPTGGEFLQEEGDFASDLRRS